MCRAARSSAVCVGGANVLFHNISISVSVAWVSRRGRGGDFDRGMSVSINVSDIACLLFSGSYISAPPLTSVLSLELHLIALI